MKAVICLTFLFANDFAERSSGRAQYFWLDSILNPIFLRAKVLVFIDEKFFTAARFLAGLGLNFFMLVSKFATVSSSLNVFHQNHMFNTKIADPLKDPTKEDVQKSKFYALNMMPDWHQEKSVNYFHVSSIFFFQLT